MEGETTRALAEYANIMNEYGIDSNEARNYFEEHCDNEEFEMLARVARTAKIEMSKEEDDSSGGSGVLAPLRRGPFPFGGLGAKLPLN